MSGWIKLHRDIMDHWIAQDCEYLAVWIRMLAEANFDDRKTVMNGAFVEVKRGQFVFGLESYSAKTKVSVRRLRKLLELLEADQMIVRQKGNKFSLITIANYCKHQDDDRQTAGESQANDNQTSSEGQAKGNTIRSEEGKEDISTNVDIKPHEEKSPKPTKQPKAPQAALDYSGWPQQPSDQTLIDWLAMRKNAKATTTQTVINRFATELTKAVAAGYSVDQCIAECCARNWKGFQLTWLQNAGVQTYDHQNHGSHSSPASQGRYENPTARVMRMAREAEQQLQGNRGTVIEAEFKRS